MSSIVSQHQCMTISVFKEIKSRTANNTEYFFSTLTQLKHKNTLITFNYANNSLPTKGVVLQVILHISEYFYTNG